MTTAVFLTVLLAQIAGYRFFAARLRTARAYRRRVDTLRTVQRIRPTVAHNRPGEN